MQKSLGDVLATLLLVLLSVASLVPLFWMVSVALMDAATVALVPPHWLPNPPQWSNFAQALTFFPFGRYFLNSALIGTLYVIGTLLSASMVGYGFARYDVPWKGPLFILILSPLFLPEQVTLIPLFLLFKNLGWIDTYYPLTVPAFLGGAPLFIFLLRQFFLTIPHDLDDAARIDGCGEFGIFWRIILPLAKPALAAVAIFAFMHSWNDFLAPLIYLNSEEKFTVTLGLARFLGGSMSETLWNLLMAASVMVVLPPLALFFAAQKYFVQGIVMTGLKG